MKKVDITGTHNRYQIKKVTRTQEDICKSRVVTVGWDSSLYSTEVQMDLLRELNKFLSSSITQENKPIINSNCLLMKQEIEKKLSGYKSQDSIKKKTDTLITLRECVDKLQKSNMLCYYCGEVCNVFYERVREMTQWSLDRIDNSVGHSADNVLVSCLKCNLHRRNTNMKKFKDTQEMKTVVLLNPNEEAEAVENGSNISELEITTEEKNTEILEPYSSPPRSTIFSPRLIQKLTQNIIIDKSIIKPIQTKR